jgi:hypothetical protein
LAAHLVDDEWLGEQAHRPKDNAVAAAAIDRRKKGLVGFSIVVAAGAGQRATIMDVGVANIVHTDVSRK